MSSGEEVWWSDIALFIFLIVISTVIVTRVSRKSVRWAFFEVLKFPLRLWLAEANNIIFYYTLMLVASRFSQWYVYFGTILIATYFSVRLWALWGVGHEHHQNARRLMWRATIPGILLALVLLGVNFSLSSVSDNIEDDELINAIGIICFHALTLGCLYAFYQGRHIKKHADDDKLIASQEIPDKDVS